MEGPAPDVAVKLAALPPPSGLVRALASVVVRYRVVERVPEAREPIDYRGAPPARPRARLATRDVIDKAAALGLRYLGVYAYLGVFGWIPREGFATEDGAIRVSARRGKAGRGLEAMMSTYYLSTTFDDGRAILTWAKSKPPLEPTDRVESVGGTGDLEKDLAAHRAAVDARLASSKARPIPCASVDDCVALTSWYDRVLTTDAQISSILWMRVFFWGFLLAIAAAAIWALPRLM